MSQHILLSFKYILLSIYSNYFLSFSSFLTVHLHISIGEREKHWEILKVQDSISKRFSFCFYYYDYYYYDQRIHEELLQVKPERDRCMNMPFATLILWRIKVSCNSPPCGVYQSVAVHANYVQGKLLGKGALD